MSGHRRLSQAISEGEAISILARVADVGAVRAAEEQGADGLALIRPVDGVREATQLPLLLVGPPAGASGEVDALVVDVEEAGDRLEELVQEVQAAGLECVVRVSDEEELAAALARIDPEIFLLSPRRESEGVTALEQVLQLLPDVPAGKLAIAELVATTREEIAALERAGVDAVLVPSGNLAELAGGPAPKA